MGHFVKDNRPLVFQITDTATYPSNTAHPAQFYAISNAGATLPVLEVCSSTGVEKFGVNVDGSLRVSKTAGTSVSTVNGGVKVYDTSGSLLGYIPIYTTLS